MKEIKTNHNSNISPHILARNNTIHTLNQAQSSHNLVR